MDKESDNHAASAKNLTLNIQFPRLPKKETLIKLLVWALIIGCVIAWWKWPAKNTIPADIRSQLNFHAVYPTKNYDPNGFHYIASSHALWFSATESGIKVLVTEQSLPANSGDNPAQDPGQMLNQLGVRYFSQIQSKLGVISVAKFWTRSYDPNGQTAILGTKGTLVLAHPVKDLSQNQWVQFFNSLRL
ncbi:MAG TPA: hypothetical protein VFK97_00220 [Candidatus Saccharimonadales bacterium]|nr:hypothetical protein [Candidatus Saccharimonadales bacterium]